MEQAGIIRNHQQRAQGKSKNSSQAAAAAGTAAKAGAVFLGLVASCHGLKVECLLAFLLAQVKEEKVFFPFSLSLSFHILYIYIYANIPFCFYTCSSIYYLPTIEQVFSLLLSVYLSIQLFLCNCWLLLLGLLLCFWTLHYCYYIGSTLVLPLYNNNYYKLFCGLARVFCFFSLSLIVSSSHGSCSSS